MTAKLTLAEHAEAWMNEHGMKPPARDTEEWQEMYEVWEAWAFDDLHGQHSLEQQAADLRMAVEKLAETK